MEKKTKIDMSAAAVTARLKLACGLGDIERMATIISSLMAEISGDKEVRQLAILIAEREGRVLR